MPANHNTNDRDVEAGATASNAASTSAPFHPESGDELERRERPERPPSYSYYADGAAGSHAPSSSVAASNGVRDGNYLPLSPSANGRYRYNVGVGKMTGLLQILCGSVTAVMGLLALVLHSHDYFLDLPLWAGLLYLFCGVFGVAATKNQTFMIGLYLLFSIMSSMMSSVVVVTEGHATFMEANDCDCSIFQSPHMLYDATAALVSCVELLVTAFAMYQCMAGLGCCTCCQPPPRIPRNDMSHPPTLMDFSNIPLPPAPIYPVLAPELPQKVPLE